jgi:hypothetical protein
MQEDAMDLSFIRSIVATATCLGLFAASAQADEIETATTNSTGEHFDSRVGVGYKINPVPLELRGKNRLLVGLGSYLVNAAGACNDCHTQPPFADGGNPFEGESEVINTAQFLAGGRQFGPITSPNITPDEHGRPAGLTFEEFEELLRTGRDGDRILQVMPWNIYGKMTRLDLRAIYEYLSAVPSLPNNPNPGP